MDLKWIRLGSTGGSEMADGFAKAVEFVVTPLIFGVAGHFLDAWLGTGIILTFVLGGWALAVTVAMTIRKYEADMRAEEERLLGPRPRGGL